MNSNEAIRSGYGESAGDGRIEDEDPLQGAGSTQDGAGSRDSQESLVPPVAVRS